jgi:hypothetical protein
MAENLLLLSAYFGDEKYKMMADPMIQTMFSQAEKYPASYALWASLVLMQSNPFFELAIIGDDWKDKADQINAEFIPNLVMASSANNVDGFSLLSDRFKEGQTLLYLCKNHTCDLPETDIKVVLAACKK